MRSPPRRLPAPPPRSGSRQRRRLRFSRQFVICRCTKAPRASSSAARSILRGGCSPRTAERGRFAMIYSTDRILTAHAGSLPRPDDVRDMVLAKARGEPYDQAALDARLRSAVAEIVKRQVACGLDVVNDGELSKPNFTDYVSARIAGCENRPGTGFRRLSMTARDETKFPEYFASHPRPRQFQVGACRGDGGGGISAGDHAGHDRTLDGERTLRERRGVSVRDRSGNARGIQSDRRCRFSIANRRSRPAGRLGLPP